MFKWVEKKDLIYLIVCLVMVIVFLVVTFFVSNDNIVSVFGFAGTLSGIILAVVALIYSFSQSITYGNANIKLEESATKIESLSLSLEKIEKIDAIAETLESTVSEIRDLQFVLSEINDSVERVAPTVIEEFIIHRNTGLSISPSNEYKLYNEEFNKEHIYATISMLPATIPIAYYFLLICRDKGTRADLVSFLNIIQSKQTEVLLNFTDVSIEHNSNINIESNLNGIFTFYYFFRNCNWISLEGNYSSLVLTHVDPSFESTIREVIESTEPVFNLINEVILKMEVDY